MPPARQPRRRAALLTAALCCTLLAGCASRAPVPDALVTGVVLARERVLLPAGAVFEATLLDLSDPGQPPVVLGRQRRADAGPPPYALWLPYPSARFAPGGRYEVRARVTLAGRLLLSTSARHPVPQDPAYRHVDLLLERTTPQPATAEAAVPLTLTWWRLSEIEGTALPRPGRGATQPSARGAAQPSAKGAPQPSARGAAQPTAKGTQQPSGSGAAQPSAKGAVPAAASGAAAFAKGAAPPPHLVLQADAPRASGSGGCNRFLADYELQGAALQFGPLTTGIALCLPGSAPENRFFAALAAVQGFRQQDRQLLLLGPKGQTLLRLDAAETELTE